MSAPASPTITSGCPLSPARYVAATGDTGVLDEKVAYIPKAVPSKPKKIAISTSPLVPEDIGTLYDHLRVRSLRHGLRFGEHGLPSHGYRRLE